MAATIITTEDLQEFKHELLEDIKAIINHQSGFSPKKWLKSPEVRDFLSISPGTLQNHYLTLKSVVLSITIMKKF